MTVSGPVLPLGRPGRFPCGGSCEILYIGGKICYKNKVYDWKAARRTGARARPAGAKEKWYGLDTSSLIREYVPLITGGSGPSSRIRRRDAAEGE